MGRTKIMIDWRRVSRYLQAQCNGVGIAGILGIDDKTLYRRCLEDNKITFAEFSATKKAEGRELLKAKQFDTAMSGDRTMLVWLGKQLLGQRDQVEQTIRLPELKVQPLSDEEKEKIDNSLAALNESNDNLPEEP